MTHRALHLLPSLALFPHPLIASFAQDTFTVSLSFHFSLHLYPSLLACYGPPLFRLLLFSANTRTQQATIYTPKTPNFGEFGPIERPTPGTAPRSKGKAVTFHPDIFHPEAPAFKPADAITFLNNDSEPDVATPTHKLAQTTANIGRAVKPLGAGKLTSSNSSKSPNVLHQGPPFTTDQEAWVSGSRYVDIGNIPIHWAETNYIMRALVSVSAINPLADNLANLIL